MAKSSHRLMLDLTCQIFISFGKRQNKGGNLLRHSESSGWNFICNVARSSSEKPAFICVSMQPACNGVYLDIAWCKFLGKTSGKRIHSSLAGGIGYFTGCSNISPDRGNINDFSGFSGKHMRNRQFTGGKYGSEIHTQNMIPFIDRHVS